MVQRKRVDTAVLSIALFARLAAFYLAASGFFLVGEGEVQRNLAENLVSGRGFMLSETMFHDSDPRRDAYLEFFRETGGFYGVLIPEQPTSFFVPGYALFQAFIFHVSSPGNLTAVVAVQLFLGILTVFLGMRLASRFLRGRWYLLAGLFMALDPFEIYFQSIPVTQSLFSLLFVSGLLVSVRFLEKPGAARGITAGFIWGLTFMVRPAAMPMVFWLILLFLVSEKVSLRSLGYSGVILLCFFLSVFPWMARNRQTMGRYQLLPLQGGVQLWEFNGSIFTDEFHDELPGARLMYGQVRDRWIDNLNMAELTEFPRFTDETEFQRDSILYSRQTEFIRANPGVFLHLTGCRFLEFFKPFPLNDYSPAHTVLGLLSFLWVGVFFFTGTILLLYRGPSGFYLAGVIGGYILIHLLTASGTPHRVGLDVPLFITALMGIRYATARISAGRKGS